MERAEFDIDDLIGKVLAGEADAGEQEIVDAWRRAHQDNERYFEQARSIFERAATFNVQISFDTDAAWQKVRNRIHQKPAGVQVEFRVSGFWRAARVAAGVILVAAAGVWVYNWTQAPAPQV